MLLLDDARVRLGRRDVLHGIDLEWEKGALGVVGENGSGKTTLLRLCAGLLRPRSGTHDLVPERDDDRAPTVGFVPQSVEYPSSMTVRDLVAYAAWLRGIRRGIDDEVASALRAVDLEQSADERLGRCSGGVVRRATFATALVGRPDLLVLDEPTTGVDPEQRLTLRRIVREQAAHRPVILSSHIIDDIEQLCDRFVVLRSGRIVFAVTPDEARAATAEDRFEAAVVALSTGRSAS